MSMLLLASFVSAIGQPAIAPASPAAPAPPPIITTARVVRPDSPSQAAGVIRVRATANRSVLLDDRFRVGRNSASFNQSRTEASDTSCPTDREIERQSIQLSVYRFGSSDADEQGYQVRFTWSRPVDEVCGGGTRSVSLEQQVRLAPGSQVVLNGDAGLRLELTRER